MNRPDTTYRRPVAAALAACLMLGIALMSGMGSSQASAAGGFDNAAVADKALSYVNQWGGNACRDARKLDANGVTVGGYGGGQCRTFVNCIVFLVSGKYPAGGGDYFSSFLNAGAAEITSMDSLSKGDIVQQGQGGHTFIIVSRVSGSTFDVVDSNSDGNNNEIVRHHQRTFQLSSNERAFRFGSVGAGRRDVVLRSRANGKLASAELGYSGADQAMVRSRATDAGSWEMFTLVGDCSSGDGCAIQSKANGKYVSAEAGYQGYAWGELRARADSIGSWERFNTEGDCGSSLGCALKAKANGRYVSAELGYTGNGAGMLRARATSIGSWERFGIGAASTPAPSAPPVATPPASAPVFTVMNTSETPPDGVWFRNSPHTADTSRIHGLGVYVNERVQLSCYAFGDAVGQYNNSLWYRVTNTTRPTNNGQANSGFLNSHYINDGRKANEVDPGVPAC